MCSFLHFFPQYLHSSCAFLLLYAMEIFCAWKLSCPPGNEDVKLLSMPLSTPEAWSYGGGWGVGEDKVPYFTFSFLVKTFKHLEQMQHEDFMLNECAGVSQICSLIALGLFSKRSRFRAGSLIVLGILSEAGHWC